MKVLPFGEVKKRRGTLPLSVQLQYEPKVSKRGVNHGYIVLLLALVLIAGDTLTGCGTVKALIM